MEEIQCWHCGNFFPKSPRHKGQYYCMKPECQKARKAAWKGYRKRNPEKAERNRILQRIRNRRRPQRNIADVRGDCSVIAKVDASSSHKIKVAGEFWMIPVIAKVDALKVYIYEIPNPYC